MVEYIVLAALIALTAVVALQASGTSLKEAFCRMANFGGDSDGLQDCLGVDGSGKDPDSTCIGSPPDCGIQTSTPTPVPSTVDACTGTFFRDCPMGQVQQQCSRSRNEQEECVEQCFPECVADCPACTLSPMPCPDDPSRVVTVISDTCRCEYDFSPCY
jgi:hypothetical protein